MPDAPAQPCPHQALIEAFARDELDEERRRQAQRILEQSEPCRQLFQQLTAGRYPRLPHYTIIGQVGKGGFGVVYKAIHHAKERTEALKVLFSKTPLLTSYFQNEVHLIAKLKHPYIATLFEAQLTTPPLYYTMEFVEGQRLNEYLADNPVPLGERIDIIKKVAAAVGYAHEQGVVHRDLKPQNVLVDAERQPHIVDFGIAKKLAEVHPSREDGTGHAKPEGPVGTLGYIAPEQQRGEKVDGRADIFALGALLFHCITGEPARLARVEDQRLKLLHDRQVTQAEDLSAIIGQCVADDPDDRYQRCEDFIADLDNYLAGRPILARKEVSLTEQAKRVFSLVMRQYVLAVRVATAFFVAALLTFLFWHLLKIYAIGPPVGDGERTVIVGLTDTTLEAIDEGRIGEDLPGLSRFNPKSWRMLFGRVMERLAEAKPLVVAIDGWMPDCTPYDAQFLRGVEALDAPVVLGAVKFDVNGDPEMCPAIRQAVRRYGAVIGRHPGEYSKEYDVVYGIERGFEFIPGLSLAAFAAARFPKCEPQMTLDRGGDQPFVRIRYRMRFAKRGQPRWEQITDKIDCHEVKTVSEGDSGFERPLLAGWLWPGDHTVRGRVPARSSKYWFDRRTFTFEQVLLASPEQLRHWFDGHAVIMAVMKTDALHEPGSKQAETEQNDLYKRGNGELVFGCQVHAEALDTLLAHASEIRLTRLQLTTRTLLWCGLGVLLATCAGFRETRRPLRFHAIVTSAMFFGGLLFGADLVINTTSPWLLELAIGATALVTAGSIALLVNILHRHELDLAPGAVTLTAERSTLESTVLAETR